MQANAEVAVAQVFLHVNNQEYSERAVRHSPQRAHHNHAQYRGVPQ